uniref:Uncharacterized protein n=1 Tax=Anopheles maculatus TaxID=74869 RepID=A0A182SMZ9_9DIPT
MRESRNRRDSATASTPSTPVAAGVAAAAATPSGTPVTPISPCGSVSSTPAKRRDIRPAQVRYRAEPCWVQNVLFSGTVVLKERLLIPMSRLILDYIKQEATPNPEAAMSPRFKRKTTQDPAHGSFFLRVGAIGMLH